MTNSDTIEILTRLYRGILEMPSEPCAITPTHAIKTIIEAARQAELVDPDNSDEFVDRLLDIFIPTLLYEINTVYYSVDLTKLPKNSKLAIQKDCTLLLNEFIEDVTRVSQLKSNDILRDLKSRKPVHGLHMKPVLKIS